MEQTDRGPGGAGSSGSHGGAGSSGGHGGAGSSGGHGGTASETAAPGPSPHLSLFGRSPTTPPQNFLGEAQGYQEPFGAKHTQTVKKTVVTVWSNTATAGWLVNTAAAVWGYHNRLA